jgi:hypothetical protein
MDATGFLNSKRRMIFKTEKGKYAARTLKGLVYNPKAKYHKSPGGTERATKYLKNTVMIPSPIRPKFDRKERKNAGGVRGKYAARVRGVRVLPVKRNPYIAEMFAGYPAKKRRSPKGNMGLKAMFKLPKVPKRKAPRAVPAFLSPKGLAALFSTRAPRKNKGIKRGPRAKKAPTYANMVRR